MRSNNQDPGKFRRYRERLRAKGLRQIQIGVPDTASPRFQEELRRQLALVEASTEDRATPEFNAGGRTKPSHCIASALLTYSRGDLLC